MKTKPLTPPVHYRTLQHTTSYAPPHDDAPTPTPMPRAVGGMSDAQAMLNIYTSWRDEAIQRGDDPGALHYDDCVNFYAAKVEREKAVAA